jgi:hypothetical protein
MSNISVTLLTLITVLTMRVTQAGEIPEILMVSSADEMISLYEEADYWGGA